MNKYHYGIDAITCNKDRSSFNYLSNYDIDILAVFYPYHFMFNCYFEYYSITFLFLTDDTPTIFL